MLSSRDTVLVTAAAGTIGLELVHWLAVRGGRATIRAGVQDPTSRRARLLRGLSARASVHPIAFDVERPQTLIRALDGVTVLVLIAPMVVDLDRWHDQVIKAALEYGKVRYAIKVSAGGSCPTWEAVAGRSGCSAHQRCEEILRRSGIANTTIRATLLMQQFLSVSALYRPGDRSFYLPIGSTPVAFLDARDISSFAAGLIDLPRESQEQHFSAAYELTGPAAITGTDIANELTALVGQPFTHVDGEAAFLDHARTLGVSALTKELYRDAAAGRFSRVEYGGFSQVTGRVPTSFAKFAWDHAAHFVPPG